MANAKTKNGNFFTLIIFVLLLMAVVYMGRARRNQLTPLSDSPGPVSEIQPDLQTIINNARSWQAAGPEFYGTPAPDMTIKDTSGTEHKISDYLGKELMIVLWATWCPPCNVEVSHLKELTDKYSPDDFKILAISTEDGGLSQVQKFAANKGINYTTAWMPGYDLVKPYSSSGILPSAFFIDSAGNFKIITQGLMDTKSIEAIVSLK